MKTCIDKERTWVIPGPLFFAEDIWGKVRDGFMTTEMYDFLTIVGAG
ncbi:MAG: hypothetical protein WCQ90_06000 [Deltaproteobacteria bacterium]